MRVLWFSTNSANFRSEHTELAYNGGGWMSALQTEIVKHMDIQLGVCFCKNGEQSKVIQDNVIYYPVPHHCKRFKDKIIDIFKIHDVTRDEILWPYYIEQFKNVINDFKPDVIEVFGSELYVGLSAIAAKELNIPCVLHIQGLLNPILCAFFPMGVSESSYIYSKGLRGIYANWQYLAYWKRSVHREKAILNAVSHVIGRTHWDKHTIEILNSNAKYHYGGEILRSCFYEGGERILPSKPVIITTSSNATYKGFDLVLKIANILKNEICLDFEWKVFGNLEPYFFEKIAGIRHTDVNVSLCGVASAERLREAMLNATVYLQPSYVENSPNSVAEAQILGLPVVATNVGGTSSMGEDGETVFLFSVTDPYMGAYNIMRFVNELDVNMSMGNAGREAALIRHNKSTIVSQLIETYKKVISDDRLII